MHLVLSLCHPPTAQTQVDGLLIVPVLMPVDGHLTAERLIPMLVPTLADGPPTVNNQQSHNTKPQ